MSYSETAPDPEVGPILDPLADPGRRLVELLVVEALDVDLFRGHQPDSQRDRVYGGQVAAQALIAAVRSAPADFEVHSLHSYFLLPGDYRVPIIYEVERLRDGRSFATRRVVARQQGRPIYYQTVSFQRREEGYEHQEPMPAARPPEEGLSLLDLMRRRADPGSVELVREWAALDVRYVGNSRKGLEPAEDHVAQSRMWVRIVGEIGDDPEHHLAAFVYATDISLLGASLVPHGGDPSTTQMASLDHTIWFHRPLRVDEWWLYDQWSPSASGGRGLSLGRVFDRHGTLAATVAQEGLIRPRDPQR